MIHLRVDWYGKISVEGLGDVVLDGPTRDIVRVAPLRIPRVPLT